MSLKNTINSYGSVTKFFHWTIAILIIGMLIFGYFLEDIPKEYEGIALTIHKSIGLFILFLVVIRIIWAFFNVKPRLPGEGPLARFLEWTVQYTLFVCMIAMPLAGWIGSSSSGKVPSIAGVKLALPIPADKPLIETSFFMHNNIAIILIVFITIHVLAALYHYFVRKDNILQRMLPQRNH